MKVKREYEALLDGGELLIMFPSLKGVWSKDKTTFVKLWESNIEAIKDIDVDYEEQI